MKRGVTGNPPSTIVHKSEKFVGKFWGFGGYAPKIGQKLCCGRCGQDEMHETAARSYGFTGRNSRSAHRERLTP
jgi:hypothetical protein